MIVVYIEDEQIEFENATRFSTDEHNNLCIWEGRQGDKLAAIFHPEKWRGVMVDHDDQD